IGRNVRQSVRRQAGPRGVTEQHGPPLFLSSSIVLRLEDDGDEDRDVRQPNLISPKIFCRIRFLLQSGEDISNRKLSFQSPRCSVPVHRCALNQVRDPLVERFAGFAHRQQPTQGKLSKCRSPTSRRQISILARSLWWWRRSSPLLLLPLRRAVGRALART